MSIWEDHDLEQEIVSILADVPAAAPPSPLGRPYVTSYQIAIELERRVPQIRQALDTPLGGSGAGEHASMAQYIGRELSQRIRRSPLDPSIEGGFLSDQDVLEVSYRRPDGSVLTSSVSRTGFDLALFRLTSQTSGNTSG